MFELWIPITILAALSQNIRSSLQKRLTNRLSTMGTTQARFLYAIPFILIYLAVLTLGFDYKIPSLNTKFFLFVFSGGVAQILGTALLVKLFSYRNFFVGITYSKTQAFQAALIGYFVLDDELTMGSIIGILIGVVGLSIISSTKNNINFFDLIRSLTTKSAKIGILSGFLFGMCAVFFRGASLALDGNFVISAAMTLGIAILIQSSILFVYLIIKEQGQLTKLLSLWRPAILVGLSGMLASVGWFTAMTIESAGNVKALGQIELVFAYIVSVFFFKESIKKTEFLGVFILVSGIIILILFK